MFTSNVKETLGVWVELVSGEVLVILLSLVSVLDAEHTCFDGFAASFAL